MKITKKTAFAVITSLILVSFFATFPASSGAHIPYPIVASSISSSDTSVSDEFKSHFGHDLNEEYWSIIYDFAGDKMVNDYNPGPYSDDLDNGTIDDIDKEDANFFMGWNNLRNVQTFYFAMQNYTLDEGGETVYGCAPYQYFLQHFRIPTTNHHIFVLNKFLGLLAYEDSGPKGIPTIPDENDSLYIGWPQFSELHKAILNSWFATFNVTEDYWIDNSTDKIGQANPIPLTYNQSAGTYKFGMSYQNIFILWQKLEIDEGLDKSVEASTIVNNCSAFSMISSINFTFTISKRVVGGYTEVNTTTEYDIGQLDELWVIGDNESTAIDFEGDSFNLTGIPNSDIGYYNTSNGISKRLTGDENTPGFGLAVINTANIAVIKMTRILFGLLEIPESVNLADFIDKDGKALGGSTDNITQASYNHSGQLVYKIDFASKPNYTINGEEYEAPTRVLANNLVGKNITDLIDLVALYTIFIFVVRATGNPYTGILVGWALLEQFLKNEFFYLTCFPEWNGGTINQDPTFSVFVPNTPPILPDLGGDEGGGGAWLLPVVFGVGIVTVAGLGVIIWKKKRK
jgi:hypothetical protein